MTVISVRWPSRTSSPGQAGGRTVDLTSRPDRAAANRLYERLGFRVRNSTVYRFGSER
ncbi:MULTISPECIES: hypothetical protein [unclassified Nonomuraea]|uniref:hypothetical protein n=1 Tax=unclassified Nonomuraea TaxID=2593643 RepID=UPI0033D53973